MYNVAEHIPETALLSSSTTLRYALPGSPGLVEHRYVVMPPTNRDLTVYWDTVAKIEILKCVDGPGGHANPENLTGYVTVYFNNNKGLPFPWIDETSRDEVFSALLTLCRNLGHSQQIIPAKAPSVAGSPAYDINQCLSQGGDYVDTDKCMQDHNHTRISGCTEHNNPECFR
jgi:hypothetical protein